MDGAIDGPNAAIDGQHRMTAAAYEMFCTLCAAAGVFKGYI